MAPIDIDSSEFRKHFAEWMTVSLDMAVKFVGPDWHFYDWFDIQVRIGTWVLPLLFLIGSFHFAPLGFASISFSASHVISDPGDATANLIIRLDTQQKVYDHVTASSVPKEAKKAIGMLLTAYLDQAVHFSPCSDGRNQRELMTRHSGLLKNKVKAFERLFGNDIPHDMQIDIMKACQAAARQLASSRANTLGKTFIGTTNYVVNLGLAFTHLAIGEFNNRTGHSIAFGMLGTWLLGAVFLSSIIGSFTNKYVARDILESLQECLEHIISGKQIFAFDPIEDDQIKKAEQALEWDGMNCVTTPSPFCPAKRRKVFMVIAFVQIVIAGASASSISATNPTEALSCRSIQQLCFVAAWILSRGLTALFRRIFSNEKQLLWIRVKDALFCVTFIIFLTLGFIGWFNSPVCWSGRLTLGGSAYIIVDPTPIIQQLANKIWPAITFPVVGFQYLYVFMLWCYYRNGANVFSMSGDERIIWRANPSTE